MASRKTLLQLRTSVRYALDELTAARWSNTTLNSYLNDAMRRVWTEVRRLRAEYFMKTLTSEDGALTILGESYNTTSLQITAGGSSITMPPDFSELYLMRVITSDYEWVRFDMQAITSPAFRTALEVTTNGEPGRLYGAVINERTLTYAPPWDRTLDTSLTYIFRLAELSADADTMQMPDPLDLAVVWYAVASALAQDLAPEAAVYEQRARSVIAEMTAADKRQNEDPVLAVSTWAALDE